MKDFNQTNELIKQEIVDIKNGFETTEANLEAKITILAKEVEMLQQANMLFKTNQTTHSVILVGSKKTRIINFGLKINSTIKQRQLNFSIEYFREMTW